MILDPEKTIQKPPTIPGVPFVGNAINFINANGIPVDFLQKAQHEYGDVIHFKVMNQSFYMVTDPELVRQILVERLADFHKPDRMSDKPRGLARFLGYGILTADHEVSKPQRKLIQPFMHRKHIEGYAETMGNMGNRLLDQWKDGTERDIHADMTQVTMWIITHTMFGIDSENTEEIEQATNSAQKIVVEDMVSMLPAWLTGRDAEAENINALITELVKGFIANYQADENAKDRNDLLSLLLETRDEDGNPVSEEFLRNNIITMFFAGHETTANTLTWAFYYLSQNPDVLKELQAEVDRVLSDGRAPTLDDLPNLPYTMMVIKETMRIQPTVPAIPRLTTEDVILGGYQLKANSIVLISPYVMHHDPEYWQSPYIFDPSRFSEENEANIDKYAYLPFGGGPRVCIGNHFALMEAQILLAQIIRHYQVTPVAGTQVEFLHQITTSPKHGLMMRIEHRKV